MTGYARKFDENITMSFRVRNNNNNNNGDDDKYIKTKIKIYAGSVITYHANVYQ